MKVLAVGDVLRLHTLVLSVSSGMPGVRDFGLLSSAVDGVRQSFGGKPLYAFPFEMAAAYLHGIVKNHAFVDGNKRTGVLACLMFLELNGYRCEFTPDDVERLALGVAEGRISRKAAAVILKQMATRL